MGFFRLSRAILFASSRSFLGNNLRIASSVVSSSAFFFRLGGTSETRQPSRGAGLRVRLHSGYPKIGAVLPQAGRLCSRGDQAATARGAIAGPVAREMQEALVIGACKCRLYRGCPTPVARVVRTEHRVSD